jgi:hypothetical protein
MEKLSQKRGLTLNAGCGDGIMSGCLIEETKAKYFQKFCPLQWIIA